MFHLSTSASVVPAHSERSLIFALSLIPQSNALFQFEARFYHSAFTKESNYTAIIRDHPKSQISIPWILLVADEIFVHEESSDIGFCPSEPFN